MVAQDGQRDLAEDIAFLQGVIAEVCKDSATARRRHASFKTCLEGYQEQPQLLDPYLEGLVSPLADHLADSDLGDLQRFSESMQVCRLLQALVNTRGHKTIIRFFPNKPLDVEKAVHLLQHMETIEGSHDIDEDAQDGSWQTRSMVLLWLSSLVLVPFDMNTIHVSSFQDGGDGGAAAEPAITWMVSVARKHLSDSGFVRCGRHLPRKGHFTEWGSFAAQPLDCLHDEIAKHDACKVTAADVLSKLFDESVLVTDQRQRVF